MRKTHYNIYPHGKGPPLKKCPTLLQRGDMPLTLCGTTLGLGAGEVSTLASSTCVFTVKHHLL